MTRYTWIMATSVSARLLYWCRQSSVSCPWVPKIGNMPNTIERLAGTAKNIASQKVSFQPKSGVSFASGLFSQTPLGQVLGWR